MTGQTGPEGSSESQNPLQKPRNPLEAVKRSWRKAGIEAGHLTGRYGYDATTGLPVAEPSNQPIQAAMDRADEENQEDK